METVYEKKTLLRHIQQCIEKLPHKNAQTMFVTRWARRCFLIGIIIMFVYFSLFMSLSFAFINKTVKSDALYRQGTSESRPFWWQWYRRKDLYVIKRIPSKYPSEMNTLRDSKILEQSFRKRIFKTISIFFLKDDSECNSI